jgi:hypothetical protein
MVQENKMSKIEVYRKELRDDLLCFLEDFLAIVTDKSLDTLIADNCKLSAFKWVDTVTVADFIEKNFLTFASYQW